MENRVILYKDKLGDTEIAIRVNKKEAISWGGLSMCDSCGNISDDLYLCPELGHYALCKKCFKEHRKNVKWWVEDLHPVFNTLIQYVINYGLRWSSKDLEQIDEFFSSKGHCNLSIRSFMKAGE